MKQADIGFAKIDLERESRKGFSEVVYCKSKTPAQVRRIFLEMAKHHSTVLGTKAAVKHHKLLPQADYDKTSRLLWLQKKKPRPKGLVLVVSAGTSDLSVAEEAALTAEIMGSRVKRFYDCGVAGLHRLTGVVPWMQKSRAIVAVAGMEGALPTVIGGLTRTPVIGVPTSIGYGASYKGVSALLTMLNSCAPGVCVVNIDNGFGAGYLAHVINTR